jgi:hypothetical protein
MTMSFWPVASGSDSSERRGDLAQGTKGNVSRRGNNHVVKWTNKVKVFLFNGPVRGKFKRGNASVGWPSSDGRRPLPSLHHRPVRLPTRLDRGSLLAELSLSLVVSYILCFKAYSIALHSHKSHTPPRPHNNRPPWLLSSRPALHLFIPSLHEELRTRIS